MTGRDTALAMAAGVASVVAAVSVAYLIRTEATSRRTAEPPPSRTTTATVSLAASPSPKTTASPRTKPGPINPDYPGLTTLRGNWTHTFFGTGPVPTHPKVQWQAGRWCARSTDQGVTKLWCGTGWNGQPNVIPQKRSVEVRIGGYDDYYHFLDGHTGSNTHPPLRTGDLAKGSATSDPDGCPLYYAGSRDNNFRIISLAAKQPKVLWSMNAATSVPDPRWNNDWDGAAQIVGDYMLEGGENSWFYVVELNKHCAGGHVSVNPHIVFRVPGWDSQLLADVPSGDISIEDSVAYDEKTKTVYFGNSGGLVQGWDIGRILRGGKQAKRVFRFWTGGENDSSIVIDDQGDLYVSDHYKRGNARAEQVGQLLKLDPTRKGDPVVWSIKESKAANGEAGFFSTPALVGNTLYASATGGDLMAVNAKTGHVYWRKTLAAPLWSGAAVVDDTLVIGDCAGTLHGFDVSKTKRPPKQTWQLHLGGCIESTPAIWNGWIYVGTRAGYEYGIADNNWRREIRGAGRRPPASP